MMKMITVKSLLAIENDTNECYLESHIIEVKLLLLNADDTNPQ